MPASTTWTDDRVEILTRLWCEGASAAVIARRLGLTRSAVMGKVHRLGLSGRARPTPPGTQREHPPERMRRISPPRLPVLEAAAPLALEGPPMTGTTDILTVGRHACRWPIGDPKAPGFALCGRRAVRGAYCAPHGALAYRATPQDHLLRLAGLA